jgi:hypothetical protein
MLWFKKSTDSAEAKGTEPSSNSLATTDEVANATAIIERVALGDFESRITNIDNESPMASLFHGINDLIDRTDAYVRESTACLEHVERSEYWRQIIEVGMVGSFK